LRNFQRTVAPLERPPIGEPGSISAWGFELGAAQGVGRLEPLDDAADVVVAAEGDRPSSSWKASRPGNGGRLGIAHDVVELQLLDAALCDQSTTDNPIPAGRGAGRSTMHSPG